MNNQESNYYSSPDKNFEKVKAALKDDKWQFRVAAARALPTLAQTVPQGWIQALLSDEHKRVRVAMLEVCASPMVRRQVPVEWVRDAMSDPEWSVRAAATWCIGHYGPLAPVAQLVQIVDDSTEDESVHAAAIDALGRIDAHTHRVCLLAALSDSSWYVREAALMALERIAEEVPVEVFADALHDESVSVRSTAAEIQGGLGKRANSYALLAALEDDELVSRAAVSAMNRLDTRVLVEAVGIMAFTPPGSLMRTTIQEEALLFQETEVSAQLLLALLPSSQQMQLFAPAPVSGLLPASLAEVRVKDILMLRDSALWGSYIDALTQLLAPPGGTAQHLLSVYSSYRALLERIVANLHRRAAPLEVAACWLLPKLTFTIGDAKASIRWPSHGSPQCVVEVATIESADGPHDGFHAVHVAVHADLHLLLWREERNEPQHFASINVLRGYTTTPREQWQRLMSFLQECARFTQ